MCLLIIFSFFAFKNAGKSTGTYLGYVCDGRFFVVNTTIGTVHRFYQNWKNNEIDDEGMVYLKNNPF